MDCLVLPGMRLSVPMKGELSHSNANEKKENSKKIHTLVKKLIDVASLRSELPGKQKNGMAQRVGTRERNYGAQDENFKQRWPYLTKSSDTLASIAEEQLGDARYLDLLVTINRAEILFEESEEGASPYFLPLTTLWLPTKREVE